MSLRVLEAQRLKARLRRVFSTVMVWSNSFSGVFARGGVLRRAWEGSGVSFSIRIAYACLGLLLSAALLELSRILSHSHAVFFLGLSCSGLFHRGWPHRFLTAPPLHSRMIHLPLNMPSLWMLGCGVETTRGQRRYVRFSALCAACSMVGFLSLNWGTGGVVVGYSGVIFGILVAQAVFIRNKITFVYFFPLRVKSVAVLLAGLGLYATAIPGSGDTSHGTHLFGAGAAFCCLRGANW